MKAFLDAFSIIQKEEKNKNERGKNTKKNSKMKNIYELKEINFLN